jgi:two-component system, sensor histidine kinase
MMNHKLNIILCDNFLKEAEYVVKIEGLTDVKLISYPANCMKCMLSSENKYSDIINSRQLDETNTRILFCSSSVNWSKEKNSKEDLKFKMCYSLLVGETLVNSYIKQGFNVVTPGWLMNWKKYVIDVWGFDSSTAKAFFKENAKQVILLDSGLYNNAHIYLKEFSEFISLDYSVLPVGTDYFGNCIINMYLKWQNKANDKIAQKKTKQLAEFAFMFDMIFEINKLIEIEDIINKMFDLFVMLTGASKAAYLRITDHKREEIYTYRNRIYNGELLEQDFNNNFDEFRIKRSNQGFILKIKVDEMTFDYLEVDDVAVGEHILEYIKLSVYIFKICSLIISKRKEYYQLTRSRIELEDESKAKSQFLANMSHEIRTPMNGIMGMTDLLLISDLTQDQKYMLKTVKSSSQALLEIINDILDLSKIEVGKVKLDSECIDIYDLLNEMEVMYRHICEKKGLTFISKVANDIPGKVIVDKTRLMQIIGNLIGNAIKFTDKGGVELSVRKVKTIQNKIVLMFSVSDTGIGIREEDINKLFTYFTQLDNSFSKRFKGTGLGLAICKMIVELMGGKISVESEYGIGSTFYFTCLLDIPNEEVKTKDTTNSISLSQSEDYLYILLVEDDYVSQLIINSFCKMKGWKLDITSNGKEALEKLESNHYNLILMDVQLPSMSGIEATKIIRSKEKVNNQHIPVIGTTAYAMNGDRELCLAAGMDDYISKPINLEKLWEVIQKWALSGRFS